MAIWLISLIAFIGYFLGGVGAVKYSYPFLEKNLPGFEKLPPHEHFLNFALWPIFIPYMLIVVGIIYWKKHWVDGRL